MKYALLLLLVPALCLAAEKKPDASTARADYAKAMQECAAMKAQARTDCEKRVKDLSAPALKFYRAEAPAPAVPATLSRKAKP
jgi:hypothetical protein